MCSSKSYLLSVLAIALWLYGCQSHRSEDAAHAQGLHIDSITVYCDDAFRYLLDQEQVIYESEQPDKHLHIVYQPEAEVLRSMIRDSFSYGVLGRPLHDHERKELLHNTNLQVDEHAFAFDAVALITNWHFDKDTLAYGEIISLLNNTSNKYKLVFEANGAGTVSYMFAQIAHSTARPSAYAAASSDDLISYIQKDEKSIGFIPFDKLSDTDDKSARELLKKVKILYISRPDTSGAIVAGTACQSDIADGSYPFIRRIHFISHGMNDRVGTGFVNFLYQERAGRIALKSGLVPTIMPQRIINVNTDKIK